MDALEGSPTLSLSSELESIEDSLPGVSLREFQNAVASLHKQGWVIPEDTCIRLATIEEEEKMGAGSRMDTHDKRQGGKLGRSGEVAAKKITRRPPKAELNLKNGNVVILRNLPDALDEDILEETLREAIDADHLPISLQIALRPNGARKAYLEFAFRDVANGLEALDGVECMGTRLYASIKDNTKRGGRLLKMGLLDANGRRKRFDERGGIDERRQKYGGGRSAEMAESRGLGRGAGFW